MLKKIKLKLIFFSLTPVSFLNFGGSIVYYCIVHSGNPDEFIDEIFVQISYRNYINVYINVFISALKFSFRENNFVL